MTKMIEYIAEQIKQDQAQVEELSFYIKGLYSRINDSIAANAGTIVKGTESMYKEIDSTFSKKTKLEQKILSAKRQIMVELGIN